MNNRLLNLIACPVFNSPIYAGDNETIIDLRDTAKAPPPGF